MPAEPDSGGTEKREPLYAEDGIDGFTLALRLRQMVAMQHWLGNREYTLGEAIQSLTQML